MNHELATSRKGKATAETRHALVVEIAQKAYDLGKERSNQYAEDEGAYLCEYWWLYDSDRDQLHAAVLMKKHGTSLAYTLAHERVMLTDESSLHLVGPVELT